MKAVPQHPPPSLFTLWFPKKSLVAENDAATFKHNKAASYRKTQFLSLLQDMWGWLANVRQ